ncbi:hypothetical protein Pmar_PMAR015248 [Perkinsus marinus ATCC 50983]|uniref:Uncharacterized protein n=1 Tax=Perkinsus marinus (strain ATCC 50983 / TXsc) TaxID=423536 RepID=C5KL51_PERM5|nr:hypothetical protein Pmar_PMAR015248 [Perkinsus marinus ATCC 50983]EER14724.1 hypothetical protein Pmar_PMAR015248 [Perkinsus marinus ATCC 50983]|eukprot:XP_002782928.1 hypothetical protein Pmar_PMAR015248 [Perkinsus marinus ATCC 50983]
MNGEGIYAFDVDAPNEPLGPPFKGHANFRTVKEVSLVGLNQEYVASDIARPDQSDDDEDDDDDDEYVSRHPVDPRLAFVGFGADRDVVNCVQQHPSELCVATSGFEDDIKLWRLGSPRQKPTLRALRRACHANAAPAQLDRFLDFPVVAMMRLLDQRVRDGTIHDEDDDDIEGDEEELLARSQLRRLLFSWRAYVLRLAPMMMSCPMPEVALVSQEVLERTRRVAIKAISVPPQTQPDDGHV